MKGGGPVVYMLVVSVLVCMYGGGLVVLIFGGFHGGLYVSVGLMVYRLLFRFRFVCNVVACWYLVLFVSCLACM